MNSFTVCCPVRPNWRAPRTFNACSFDCRWCCVCNTDADVLLLALLPLVLGHVLIWLLHQGAYLVCSSEVGVARSIALMHPRFVAPCLRRLQHQTLAPLLLAASAPSALSHCTAQVFAVWGVPCLHVATFFALPAGRGVLLVVTRTTSEAYRHTVWCSESVARVRVACVVSEVVERTPGQHGGA